MKHWILDLPFWWTKDKTTIKATQLESLTTVHGFHILISQPTHLLPQTSSCIDLIFTEIQPNLIVDSGVHPSLHWNCHHQITCCKCNRSIQYQPPLTDSLPAVHCNIFHERKSLKTAWVKTNNLLDADS